MRGFFGLGSFVGADAVKLIWQNLIPAPGGGSLQIFPNDIDPNIETAGRSTVAETVMYLTLHADTAGGVVQRNSSSRWSLPAQPGRPRWRSMQTALSAVGSDFTRNEFLEFWVYEDGLRSADSAQTRSDRYCDVSVFGVGILRSSSRSAVRVCSSYTVVGSVIDCVT